MFYLLLITVLNAAYVSAAPSPTVFYIANVLLHLGLGAATVVALGIRYRRSPRMLPLALAAAFGL
jgi:hypothetical protein